MPVWLVEPEEAKRLGVSLLELWWMQDHGYSDRLAQFRHAWAILDEHAGERQQRAQQEARYRAEGWQGGPTDPLADCIVKNPEVLVLMGAA